MSLGLSRKLTFCPSHAPIKYVSCPPCSLSLMTLGLQRSSQRKWNIANLWPPFTAKLPAWWRGSWTCTQSVCKESLWVLISLLLGSGRKANIYILTMNSCYSSKRGWIPEIKTFFNKDTVPHKNNILNVQATIKSHWSHEESGNHNVNE